MSDVIAAPSVRALAREKNIDLDKLARELGRTTIAREDLSAVGTTAPAQSNHSAYWDMYHEQYGTVTKRPAQPVCASRIGQPCCGQHNDPASHPP